MLGGIKTQGKMKQACQEFLSSDVGDDNVGQMQNQRRKATGRQRPLWPSGANSSVAKDGKAGSAGGQQFCVSANSSRYFPFSFC